VEKVSEENRGRGCREAKEVRRTRGEVEDTRGDGGVQLRRWRRTTEEVEDSRGVLRRQAEEVDEDCNGGGEG
jgi:hypothetical protein